ncbi:MAG: hypothetical protein SPI97_05195 [Oscillospiraceae bacterium]|nr:hypothetical protein [Oscillospiraceae bacterium]
MEVIFMGMSHSKAIENAAASVEMEGFVVTEEYKMLCEKLLVNEITFDEYVELIKKTQGIVA